MTTKEFRELGKWPNNLYSWISKTCNHQGKIPDDFIQNLNIVLETGFDELERNIVFMKFHEYMNYRQISDKLGISRYRLNIRMRRILRKFYYSSKRDLLLNGSNSVDYKNGFNSNINDIPIATDIFSYRVFAALRRHGIDTLGDLLKLDSVGLNHVRNLGKKGINEINEVLNKFKIEYRFEFIPPHILHHS